jgi:hypothetical protein
MAAVRGCSRRYRALVCLLAVTPKVLQIRLVGALAVVAVAVAGCATAARRGAEDSSEAALRRYAVAVRTKPLWLDAMFEGEVWRCSRRLTTLSCSSLTE